MSKKNSKHRLFRQGDVLVAYDVETTNKPGTEVAKQVTLALGEVTGHHHSVLDPRECVGYANSKNGLARNLEIKEKAVLTHQEHAPIALPPGNPTVHRQVEFTPAELRNVRD